MVTVGRHLRHSCIRRILLSAKPMQVKLMVKQQQLRRLCRWGPVCPLGVGFLYFANYMGWVVCPHTCTIAHTSTLGCILIMGNQGMERSLWDPAVCKIMTSHMILTSWSMPLEFNHVKSNRFHEFSVPLSWESNECQNRVRVNSWNGSEGQGADHRWAEEAKNRVDFTYFNIYIERIIFRNGPWLLLSK